MSLFHKNLSDIKLSDIMDLITEQIVENKHLDYKRGINLKKDEAKIDILKDIVSFANSQGGDLIIGVSEKEGVPKEINGIEINKVDELKRAISSVIGRWIEPKITKYEFSSPLLLEEDNQKCVLIIRVFRSFNIPHLISDTKEYRFWYRNSSGNEMMDLQQIKSSIDFSQNIGEKIKRFLAERISIIESNETTYELKDKSKTVIHFIPINNFLDNKQEVDLSKILDNRNAIYTGISHWSGGNYQYNIEGLIRGGLWGKEKLYDCYLQYFRNGIIESVDNYFIYPGETHPEVKDGVIPVKMYEKELSIRIIPKFLELMKLSNLETPIWILITLLNVKGFKAQIKTSRYSSFEEGIFPAEFIDNSIKKNIINFPLIIIENYDESIFQKLLPAFNFLWNLAGYEKTNSFDNDGNFIEVN